MNLFRGIALAATMCALTACGFHMRGEVQLPAGMQRVHVQIADRFSPLKRDVEAALKRSGAVVEANPGVGIAEIVISAVSLAPVVRSVGANAFVNEFSMVYHVELRIDGADGKTLLAPEAIEHSRDYTFDQSQAIGSNAEQDEIRKEMERDMVQAIMRKVEAAEHRLEP
ncbi:MAG TPA: LPS assembly lipoprotein LptE [Rudaea sp.]|nr:LPS assembly lipoprotein LptE [Rudaea sp.]